jgi:hypothetical protein
MKTIDSHFDHYLYKNNDKSLHKSLISTYNNFPKNIENLKNLLFYGPSGVGKYTQMLNAIRQYSPSDLKYEKKISISYNKNVYFFKISDIHYEIDMSLMGCHSKMLWNEVYNQIVDILLAKPNKTGIIVCKYFHEIHSELLDIFYSYMQQINNNINLKFIIITEELSFIPDNIVNCCHIIKVPRPSKTAYNCCLKTVLKKDIKLHDITNIKNIYLMENQHATNSNEIICNRLVDFIITSTDINFYNMRENIYDIFIYNLNSYQCIWFILNKLISMKKINPCDMSEILIKIYNFLQYYNNNYRPIYHFENFIVYLAMKVNNTANSPSEIPIESQIEKPNDNII